MLGSGCLRRVMYSNADVMESILKCLNGFLLLVMLLIMSCLLLLTLPLYVFFVIVFQLLMTSFSPLLIVVVQFHGLARSGGLLFFDRSQPCIAVDFGGGAMFMIALKLFSYGLEI